MEKIGGIGRFIVLYVCAVLCAAAPARDEDGIIPLVLAPSPTPSPVVKKCQRDYFALVGVGFLVTAGLASHIIVPDIGMPEEGSYDSLEDADNVHQKIDGAELACKGDNACGPAALSTGVMWLSKHGYPNLALRGRDPAATKKVNLHEMSRLSRGDDSSGTWPADIAGALNARFAAAGYAPPTIDVMGWASDRFDRHHRDEAKTGFNSALNVASVASATAKGDLVWLLINKAESENGTLQLQHGAHWVLVTGVTRVKKFGPDDVTLRFLDPAGSPGNVRESRPVTFLGLFDPMRNKDGSSFSGSGYSTIQYGDSPWVLRSAVILRR